MELDVLDKEQSRIQAQLTRFQQALGLKKIVKEGDLENYKYGHKLERLDGTKVSTFECRGDAIICFFDLVVVRDSSGKATDVSWAYRNFLAYSQASLPLEKMVQKRRERAVELASRIEHTGTPRVSKSHVDSEGIGKLNAAIRKICTFSKSKDGRIKNNTILLLADKEKTLNDLKALGADAIKDAPIIEILDIRELDQASTLRRSYSRHDPEEARDIEISVKLRNIESVWNSRKCNYLSSDDKLHQKLLSSCVAAFDLAVQDACEPGWLLSYELLDGGDFSGPCAVDPSLPQIIEAKAPKTATTPAAAVAQPVTSNTTQQPSSITPKAIIRHRLNCPLPLELANLVPKYQQATRELQRLLLEVSLSPANKAKVKTMHSTKTYIEDGRQKDFEEFTSCLHYKIIADIVKRTNSFTYTEQIANVLDKDIEYRQKVSDWYALLDVKDERFKDNKNHVAFLDLMKYIRKVLST